MRPGTRPPRADMCGIAGILGLDGAPVDPGALHRMAALMAHRGPDGQGFAAFPADHTAPPLLWRDPRQAPRLADAPIGLAHRRLAILDLTETGHQPMGSPDGRYWIVLNGEIYNHGALREELKGLGAVFRSRSDTEVVLAAWAAWGERSLERLEGMFAFAVWDWPGHRLFLARDRFGIKPLYYAEAGPAFAFASEIKPVLSGLSLPVKPRAAAVYDLLVRGRKDHRPETFFESVLQLPPGHLLTVKARAAAPRAWYDLGAAVRQRMETLPRDPTSQVRLFREAFEASVRAHLRSDVPTGTCLSGGLDSSAIVCQVAGFRGETLRALGATPGKGGAFDTFSARSDDPALDEGRFIDAVTRATGLPNHPVRPGGPDFLDALPDLLWHQEEPFPTGSMYAQWRVMQEASALGVKVLLDGQGADELLGGYPGMHLAAVADDLRTFRWGRAHATFWDVFPDFPRLRGIASALWLAFRSSPPAFVERSRRTFLTPGLVAAAEPLQGPADLGGRFRTGRLEQTLRHLPALLHYEDRNSMAHGLEARVPFLDRELAELSLALPAEALLAGGLSKQVLRRAMDTTLPTEVRTRRDKIGFATPDSAWLGAGGARVTDMVAGLQRSGSPWVDWKAVASRGPVPISLLLADLWRSQILTPGYLDPRSP